VVYFDVAKTGRPKALLELTVAEREQLAGWARRRKSSQALALRSRIVLGCGDGLANKEVAAREGVSQPTVGKWRSRFVDARLDGLVDDPRPGRPPTVTAGQVEEVVVATLESTPKNATHWSRAKMAERSGLSASTIGRIWSAFELKPHRADGFKLSNDPLFVDKVYDVVGLYLNPPNGAVVYCVDEKSQVQALARSQPAFPMMPGMPEKRTHDYLRHGVTSLFAAFNTADGSVISSLHRRHRSVEFKKFLAKIDSEVPDGLDIHLVCDNYGTHKSPTVRAWLENHPRFHVHFTPTYSSWINQVERFFAYITADLLQRSDHRSVQALEADIRNWIKDWNENPKPFIWTKTADQILEKLGRLLQRINGAGH
jgi:transposase/transcriptional regulator with XRE-family HTH domain